MRILQYEISGIEFKELANKVYPEFEFTYHNATDTMIFMLYERNYVLEIGVCNIISIKENQDKIILDAVSSNPAFTLLKSTWGQRRFFRQVRNVLETLQERHGFELKEIKEDRIPWYTRTPSIEQE